MDNSQQKFNAGRRIFLILFFLLPCFAQGAVFKCVNEGKVSYQATPCASGDVPYKELPPQAQQQAAPMKIQIAPRAGAVMAVGIAASVAGSASSNNGQAVSHIQVACGSNQDPQFCEQQNIQANLNNAIYQGNTGEVRRLLAQIKDVHYLSPAESSSPFVSAVENGYLEIVKALLDKKVDPLARNEKGASMLAAAIERAQGKPSGISPAMYQCLNLALDKAAAKGMLKPVFPLNATLAFSHKADPALLKYLLKYGADPDAKPEYGYTATEAAFNQNQPEMMKIILNAKPRDPARNLDKMAYRTFLEKKPEMLTVLRAAGGDHIRYVKNDPQPLFDALQPDHKIEELEFVLNSGANPNALRNPQMNMTPLSMSVPYPDKLRLLIKHGADVNAKGLTGTVLVDVLFRSRQNMYAPPGQLAPFYPSLEIVRLLLDSGAKVNGDIGGFGQFGALAATKPGDKAMIQLLLDHGATLASHPDRKMIALMAGKNPNDPNFPEPSPEGPVTLAIGLEREDLALALLEHDKKIDPHDQLALVQATRKRWDNVALALLHTGADAKVADSNGISALAIAKSQHNEAMEHALIAAGAPASTPPAPPMFKGRDPFETLVANEIDRSVHFDPPSFTLARSVIPSSMHIDPVSFPVPGGIKEPISFAFYNKVNGSGRIDNESFNQFEKVQCNRSAAFQFLAHANLTGGIQVGVCDNNIPRLRELATNAEASFKTLLGTLGGSGMKADPEMMKKMGWLYEKSKGKDGAEIYSFPVMVVGHGLLVSSTVVMIAADNRRAAILQADTMNLCENHRMHTPLCDNMKSTLTDIAQHVLLDSASP